MTRGLGERITPSQRIAYSAQLREYWAREPLATNEQARAATGAPYHLVREVHRRLVRLGLAQSEHTRRALMVTE